MKLRKVAEEIIIPKPPFAFDPTFHKPDHFPSNDNYFEVGIRWQTFRWRNECLGIKFENKGSVNKPKIMVNIYGVKSFPKDYVDSLIEEIKYRYNLDLDLKEFYKKFRNDQALGSIINKWKGMRPGHPSSLYEYLIIGVVLQNTTVRRSIQMLQVLLENYGTFLEFDSKKLWCFWKPGGLQKISEEDLRMLKVGYRAKSIKIIDTQFGEGQIDEMDLREKNMETQKNELLKLYGVGPATVWYLLFDIFHHFDFFTHVSPWEQKIYSKLFFDKDPENPVSVEKLLNYFEKFDKYKQLAVHYIWEDLWWKRKNQNILWLEKLIRI